MADNESGFNFFANFPTINQPFGANDKLIDIPHSVGDGITEEMAIPQSAGGVGISRHKINGLGFLATLGYYLDNIGYQFDYDPEVALEGYPKGAIVSTFDGENYKEFISKTDNNTDDPDKSLDQQGNQVESNNWKPIFQTHQYNFFPDYSKGKVVESWTYSSNLTRTMKIPAPGWVNVKRTFVFREEYPDEQLACFYSLAKNNYVELSQEENVSTEESGFIALDNLTIWSSEGMVASRFFPISKDFDISVFIGTVAGVSAAMQIQVTYYPLIESDI